MTLTLEKIIVAALLAGAVFYVARVLVKKFKSPRCGDDCACSAKKIIPRKNPKPQK